MTASTLGLLVWPATGTVCALGLAAEIGEFELGLDERLVELFSLSYEANVPTWFATVLLFSCASVLAMVALDAQRQRDRARHHWLVLALLFLYISLDEAIEIHEHAAFFDTSGVLYFSWVIPASVVVGLIGLAFVPFLWRLPSVTRRRFIVAGTIYVGGALGMELPLGWWTDSHGDDNLGYGLIDWTEETLELVGTSLFLLSVWSHRATATRDELVERPPPEAAVP